jgi:hypothetical protein
MQYPWKYQAKKMMKFRVLKVESANFTLDTFNDYYDQNQIKDIAKGGVSD